MRWVRVLVVQHKRLVVYTRGRCIIKTKYFGIVFCRHSFIWVIFCLGVGNGLFFFCWFVLTTVWRLFLRKPVLS